MLRLTVEIFKGRGGRESEILSQYWILNNSMTPDGKEADYIIENTNAEEVLLLKDFPRKLGHMALVKRIAEKLAPKYKDDRWK